MLSRVRMAAGQYARAPPSSGRKRSATFIAAATSHFWKGVKLAGFEINGEATDLISRDGVPVALAAIDVPARKKSIRSCRSLDQANSLVTSYGFHMWKQAGSPHARQNRRRNVICRA